MIKRLPLGYLTKYLRENFSNRVPIRHTVGDTSSANQKTSLAISEKRRAIDTTPLWYEPSPLFRKRLLRARGAAFGLPMGFAPGLHALNTITCKTRINRNSKYSSTAFQPVKSTQFICYSKKVSTAQKGIGNQLLTNHVGPITIRPK